MLHQKYVNIQEYKNSTEKNEHQFLFEKGDGIKLDNIKDENEGIVQKGYWFYKS